LKKTVQNLLTEYGTVAVIVYFTIFFAVLGGFWLAIRFGWRPTSAAGTAGTLAAAYIATKLTQPIRIAATLLVTPVVAKLYERMRGRQEPGPNDPGR
jgi:ABC-type siderophore export system fused ATPase/permease subunit